MPIYTKVGGLWKSADSSVPIASSSTYGIVKSGSNVTSNANLTPCPIIGGIPYYENILNNVHTQTLNLKGLSYKISGQQQTGQSTWEYRYQGTVNVTCGFKPTIVIPNAFIPGDLCAKDFSDIDISIAGVNDGYTCTVTYLNSWPYIYNNYQFIFIAFK